MEKIYNITGYWNMGFDYNFDEKDKWDGLIVLDEDGWFEGIVNNPANKKRIILGMFIPEKGIEIIKIDENNMYPLLYHCKKVRNSYDGEFNISGLLGEIRCGMAHITVTENTIIKENGKEELINLINNMKKNILNSYKTAVSLKPEILKRLNEKDKVLTK